MAVRVGARRTPAGHGDPPPRLLHPPARQPQEARGPRGQPSPTLHQPSPLSPLPLPLEPEGTLCHLLCHQAL
ncbi:hypothetical protein Pmani_034793 [Petrolisthes manimaculis]|uniref:Uncharacterized protein n=1 Tax=Petrolisthes manimaculis TaxID=1843537 RepID=A0AAE1NNL0_9EUCA|nr:hypothetical protein Pmani_034793 [Petrolisthes manimaculis]